MGRMSDNRGMTYMPRYSGLRPARVVRPILGARPSSPPPGPRDQFIREEGGIRRVKFLRTDGVPLMSAHLEIRDTGHNKIVLWLHFKHHGKKTNQAAQEFIEKAVAEFMEAALMKLTHENPKVWPPYEEKGGYGFQLAGLGLVTAENYNLGYPTIAFDGFNELIRERVFDHLASLGGFKMLKEKIMPRAEALSQKEKPQIAKNVDPKPYFDDYFNRKA